ncbi:MAG: rod shape-determining protein RodA [Candidatus Paceibacterota bacterium]
MRFRHIDWLLVGAVLPITLAGAFTMRSFGIDDTFFARQILWLVISLIALLFLSFIDFRFLRRTGMIVLVYVISLLLLLAVLLVGDVIQGSQRWINFGFFSFQPSDLVKLGILLVLAKYFSRRHIEIANIRHIIISGTYVFLLFALVFVQPDLGTAIIFFMLWLGMVLVSGISKKHLFLVFFIATISFGGLWATVLEPYQKNRIMSFIHPLADIQGTGYNAYQSTIAVGSGQLFGKGIGYGTQSKLQFLPEYQTDFIFASFAEEWGYVGVLLLFMLFGVVQWRILRLAMYGSTNFESLFAIGLSIYFMCHFTIHVGMNIGVLPVTGTTFPFMSYGGSHLLTEFIGLGILFGMNRYSRITKRDAMTNEIIGI